MVSNRFDTLKGIESRDVRATEPIGYHKMGARQSPTIPLGGDK